MPIVFPIAPNDIASVTIVGRHNGQRTMSVLHYRFTGPSLIADGSAVFDNLYATFISAGDLYLAFLDATSAEWFCEGIRIQKVYPTRYKALEYFPASNQGLVAGNSIPPANAVAITKRASVSDKHGTGTLHCPGVALALVEDGLLNATGVALYTILANRLDDVLAPATGEQWTPVIYNRSAPNASYTIADAAMKSNIRTQRTRVIGKGE